MKTVLPPLLAHIRKLEPLHAFAGLKPNFRKYFEDIFRVFVAQIEPILAKQKEGQDPLGSAIEGLEQADRFYSFRILIEQILLHALEAMAQALGRELTKEMQNKYIVHIDFSEGTPQRVLLGKFKLVKVNLPIGEKEQLEGLQVVITALDNEGREKVIHKSVPDMQEMIIVQNEPEGLGLLSQTETDTFYASRKRRKAQKSPAEIMRHLLKVQSSD